MKFDLKSISWKKIAFNFFIYAIIIILFAYLHLLKYQYTILLMLLLLIAVPFEIYAEMKRNYEKKRFDELCLYMKHMIINYKITNKILYALKDTIGVFDKDSVMYDCIKNAINKIEKGVFFDKALLEIEQKYFNSYIQQIHQFMILGETEVGTEVYTSLSQINIKQWQEDVEIFEMNKYKIKKNNLYFAFGSLGFSYFTLNIMSEFSDLLQSDEYYQQITLMYFAFFIVAYVISSLMLTSKWIKENE